MILIIVLQSAPRRFADGGGIYGFTRAGVLSSCRELNQREQLRVLLQHRADDGEQLFFAAMLEHLFDRIEGAERLRLPNVSEQQRDRVFADAVILIWTGAGGVGDATGRERHADFIRLIMRACAFAAQFHPLARGFRNRAVQIVTLAALEAFDR